MPETTHTTQTQQSGSSQVVADLETVFRALLEAEIRGFYAAKLTSVSGSEANRG